MQFVRVDKHRYLGLSFVKVVLLTIEVLPLLKFVKWEDLRSHRKTNIFIVFLTTRTMKG